VPDRVSRLGALVAVLVLALLAGCGGTSGQGGGAGVVAGFSEDDDGMHGAVLSEPYTLPAATLTDTGGRPFALREELDRPVTLVFFGYSRCPDICQAVMADLASAMARLAPADAERVAVWFVTTDPARDDPATLRAYLDRFGEGFEGLTGPLPRVEEVARGVHVPIERGPRLPSGGYEVTHGTPILAVTPDGSVPLLWTEGTSAAKLAEDLTTYLSDGLPDAEQDGADR
jgi:protein SCO1/2